MLLQPAEGCGPLYSECLHLRERYPSTPATVHVSAVCSLYKYIHVHPPFVRPFPPHPMSSFCCISKPSPVHFESHLFMCLFSWFCLRAPHIHLMWALPSHTHAAARKPSCDLWAASLELGLMREGDPCSPLPHSKTLGQGMACAVGDCSFSFCSELLSLSPSPPPSWCGLSRLRLGLGTQGIREEEGEGLSQLGE